MSVRAMLVQTATIARWSSRTPGSDLQVRPDWAIVEAGVRCNVQVKGAVHSGTVDGIQVTWDAVGYFPAGTDLRPQVSDANKHGDRVTVDGATYQVRAVHDQVGRSAFLKALLKRV